MMQSNSRFPPQLGSGAGASVSLRGGSTFQLDMYSTQTIGDVLVDVQQRSGVLAETLEAALDGPQGFGRAPLSSSRGALNSAAAQNMRNLAVTFWLLIALSVVPYSRVL